MSPNKFKQLLFQIGITVILSHSLCFAQQRVEIPSSFNPVGSGARALGMGGAFMAVADDATAASWNPAGLVQLERPEISLVYEAFHRTEDNSFSLSPEASGEESISKGAINYLSAVWPFAARSRNMVLSLNYQRLYDFTREWDFRLLSQADDFSSNDNYQYRQDGDLSALGLSYAVQITPQFSVGLTLNVWDNDLSPNEWEEKLLQWGSGNDRGQAFYSQSLDTKKHVFRGINANIGILWEISSSLRLGAVLKTPFDADMDYFRTFSQTVHYPDMEAQTPPVYEEKEDQTLEMPLSYGMGLAYRFSPNFMLSADIYRTQWDDFVMEDEQGNRTSPITGKSTAESDIDPTHQVRIGAEYLFTTEKFIIPLCAGIFYDPAPAPGSPDDFYGFSLGSGIGYQRFHFDIAYQYRLGNDAAAHIMGSMPFSQDVSEHTVYSSLVLHF
ncbi:MAG: OmpP1/FadL family transporter [Desulfococcaceae bacterium]